MFVYALNNPVAYDDETGHWPKISSIFKGIAVAAAVVATVAVCVAAAVVSAPVVVGGVVAGTAAALGSAARATKVSLAATGASVVSNAIEKKYSNMPRNHTVYRLVYSQNTTQYVGRTTNVNARRNGHKQNPARFSLDFVVIKSDFNRIEARGIEQIEMLHYHTINTNNKMNNQINGISPSNPNLGKYMEAGRRVLKYMENQISNEILYWTGN